MKLHRILGPVLAAAIILPGSAFTISIAQALPGDYDIDNLASGNITKEDIVDTFVGDRTPVSNVIERGAGVQIGTFSGFTGFGVDSGVALSTGYVSADPSQSVLPGPNTFLGTGEEIQRFASDPDLAPLAAYPLNDTVSIEFDFVPLSDLLQFQYVFGSEEYTGYVCSQYIDLFGVFLDGVHLNIGVSSVNDIHPPLDQCEAAGLPRAANPLLYRDNPILTNNYDTGLNGITTVLQGEAAVTKGQPHHIKFVIADVYDSRYDSALLLKAGSFVTAFPEAVNDEAKTAHDTPVTIPVLTNDVNPESLDAIVSPPSNGTATIVGDQVEYTPKPGFSGKDKFTYEISGIGGTDTAEVDVLVTPSAVDDVLVIPPGKLDGTKDVILNDNGTNLRVIGVGPASNGTVEIVGGQVKYTPNTGYFGNDTFVYTAWDEVDQEVTATVTVTVEPFIPEAINDSATTPVNTPVTIPVLPNDINFLTLDTITVLPTHGTVAITPTSEVTYTPATDFSGTDTFIYRITGQGGTDTATVTVLVTPTATDDILVIPAGEPDGTKDVIPNDNGSNLRVVSVGTASNGTVEITLVGLVKYTPNPGYFGNDTFTYTAWDNEDQAATANVLVTVDPLIPQAIDDSATTPVNTPITISILPNDINYLTLDAITVQPTHGTVAITPTSQVAYTPNPDFSGTDTFEYRITGQGGTDTAVVTVLVTPTATDDILVIPAGQPDGTKDVIPNDNGSNLKVTHVGPASNGTVDIIGGLVKYTPNPGFFGNDSFIYTAEDDEGQTVTATVTVTVDPLIPEAIDDSATTPVDTPITIAVLPNDINYLTLDAITVQPTHGTVLIVGDDVEYAPNLGYSGTDTFIYRITGQGGTDTATVTVLVTPTATDDVIVIPAGQPDGTVDVIPNDKGSNLKVTHVGPAGNGTVEIVGGHTKYTPNPGFFGNDSFIYTAEDDEGQTVNATVTVRVDPPIPEAIDDSATTPVDTPVTIPVLPNDIHALTVDAITVQPTHGTVLIVGDDVEYVPNAGFSGTDTFIYRITGHGGTDTAVVTVLVTPTATDDILVIPAGQPDGTKDVIPNDNGSDLKVTHVGLASNGTVEIVGGLVKYTPNPGFHGDDAFVYTAEDNEGQTVTANVTVTVDPLIPEAIDDKATTPVDTPVTIPVLPNDINFLTLDTITVLPTHGTVAITPTSEVTYTPAPGFSGTDTFIYRITGQGGTDTATVTVLVTPTATDDVIVIPAGQPDGTVDVIPNDKGTNLKVTHVGPASNGTVEIVGGHTKYTPNPGFFGSDSFIYTAEDDEGQIVTATVTVSLNALIPEAIDDKATTPVDTPVTIPVLPNDINYLTLDAIVRDPANGTVVITATSLVTYTPKPGFSGTDTFEYGITGQGGTDTATVTVLVTPTATDNLLVIPGGQPNGTIDVIPNDNGSDLKVISVGPATNGTVEIVGGLVKYTPNSGFFGDDQFIYTAEDNEGQEVTATVRVRLNALIPEAIDDSATTPVDTPITFPLLPNDINYLTLDALVRLPANGTVEITPSSQVTYTPNPGFSGTDTFEYRITGQGGTDTATVTVLVTPTATDNLLVIPAGNLNGTIDVIPNDNGSDLKVISVGPASNGTVDIVAGLIKYTPNPSFFGSDQFIYTAEDNEGQKVTATVRVSLNALIPEAIDDSATTPHDTPVTISVFPNDINFLSLDAIVRNPVNGTVVITPSSQVLYTPRPGFSGEDDFVYRIIGQGGTDTATVTVTVTPVAAHDLLEIPPGEPHGTIDVTPNDNGTNLKVVSVGTATNGTVEIVGGHTKYTPTPGFTGDDEFTYTAHDDHGQPVTATVKVKVLPPVPAPEAIDDEAKTPHDTPVRIALLPNDKNASALDAIVKDPVNGALTIVGDDVVYTPRRGFSGEDQFEYRISGLGGTDTAVVKVLVTPTAGNDTLEIPPGESDGTIHVTPNDNGSNLTVKSVGPAVSGTAEVTPDGKITYTPNPGFTGDDQFTYTAYDDHGQAVTATVKVKVHPLAATPVAPTPAPASPAPAAIKSGGAVIEPGSSPLIGLVLSLALGVTVIAVRKLRST